mmetsp:Transcript_28663/g.57777  ORF Transcript_28663/g.57777 Transcript_28663/m.57777 type:complete len:80 (+) Transcript_28663:334-573(+)
MSGEQTLECSPVYSGIADIFSDCLRCVKIELANCGGSVHATVNSHPQEETLQKESEFLGISRRANRSDERAIGSRIGIG